ncbi:MAG: amidohydrolase family protein, partial [Candidatus Aminicenantes bacterium]
MKTKKIFLGIFLFLCMSIWAGINQSVHAESGHDYDVLIKKGKVFDGSLHKAVRADVAVKDGVIIQVARSIKGTAAKVIEAKGLTVTPGFIDLHTHVDRGMYFLEKRACLNYLKQGVTTVVVGQCGRSAWPIFEQAEDLVKHWSDEGIGPNAALLVGHGQVREIVMGMEDREPTPEEVEGMKALVQEAMEQGACGLSTGLGYLPGKYSTTEEVIELVKVIAPYGGIYHTHMRDEGEKLIESVNEAIEIAEESGAPVHISHFKAVEKPNWGLVKEACALIEEAQKRGVVVTADQYPYQFSSGYPYRSLIPSSAWLGIEQDMEEEQNDRFVSDDIDEIFDYLRDRHLLDLYHKITPYIPLSERHQQFLEELPRKDLVRLVGRSLVRTGSFRGSGSARERMLFLERLKDPEEAQKIRTQIRTYLDVMAGVENILVGICVEKNLEGRSLARVAAMKGKSVEDTAIELELMGARCIPLRMCDEDVVYIMKKDYVGTGSDGTTPFYGIGLTHIRSYSTFLHKIKKYALERKVVSLPHVIRSHTSLPAQIMNWEDRGWIKEGYKADVVVLDLENIRIRTSISNPHAYSEGVKYLLINGKLVLDNGQWTGTLPGEV